MQEIDKVFEVLLLLHPTEEERRKGEHARLLDDVQRYVARDQQTVLLLAARRIPTEYMDKLDRLQLLIRPFDVGLAFPAHAYWHLAELARY